MSMEYQEEMVCFARCFVFLNETQKRRVNWKVSLVENTRRKANTSRTEPTFRNEDLSTETSH